MSDKLHTPNINADLPQGEPAKNVYTHEQVMCIIQKDREAVIEYIKEDFLYDMTNFFNRVPIVLSDM